MVPPFGHDVVGLDTPLLAVLPAEAELGGAAIVEHCHTVRALAVSAVRYVHRLRLPWVVETYPEPQGVTCNTVLEYSTQGTM